MRTSPNTDHIQATKTTLAVMREKQLIHERGLSSDICLSIRAKEAWMVL